MEDGATIKWREQAGCIISDDGRFMIHSEPPNPAGVGKWTLVDEWRNREEPMISVDAAKARAEVIKAAGTRGKL